MTLMPVTSTSDFGESSANFGGSRWMPRRSFVFTGPRPSIGVAEQVEHAAERFEADRHGDRAAGVDRVHAANEAVSAAEGDAADAAAAQVLLHLAGEVDLDAPLGLGVDLEGVVDLRQVPLLELHVERGADDLDNRAGLLCLVETIGASRSRAAIGGSWSAKLADASSAFGTKKLR